MASKAVFVNIGFDPTPALEIVSTLNLSSGDRLVVVYPRNDDSSLAHRGEQTRQFIKSHLAMLRSRGRNIAYRELELGLDDLNGCVNSLVDALSNTKKEGFKVFFELTGGVRSITVLMSIVACWVDQVEAITLITETGSSRISLPVLPVKILTSNVLRRVVGIVASKEGVRRKTISEETKLSMSTISRAVTALKRMGVLKEELRTLTLNDRFKCLSGLVARLPDSGDALD